MTRRGQVNFFAFTSGWWFSRPFAVPGIGS